MKQQLYLNCTTMSPLGRCHRLAVHRQPCSWMIRSSSHGQRPGPTILPAAPKRKQGRVKWYNQQKKYGFIIAQKKELFVHRDDLNPATLLQDPHLFMGEYVEYEPIPGHDGAPQSSQCKWLASRPPDVIMGKHQSASFRRNTTSLFFML